jgi:tripartite-type tricarboxylate transporter receptor subunit TctC
LQAGVALARLQAGVLLAPTLLPRATRAADAYPNRPVRIVVPYLAGGILDALARLLSGSLQRSLGQPFLVENRGGAGGNLGTALVARAKAEPYTLLMGSSGPLAINPALGQALPYDPIADFAPIALMAATPLVLAVRADAPIATVADFIAWAKARPEPVLYGTPGIGTPQHMATELLRLRAGFAATQVPYQGSAAVITAMLAGDVGFVIENQALVLPQVEGGTLRALAVTSPQRSAALPDVPTLLETGLTGFETRGWYGLLAPAGVPAEVIAVLNQGVRDAVASPDVVAKLASFGSPIVTGSPDDFAQLIAADIARWRAVARAAKIVLE